MSTNSIIEGCVNNDRTCQKKLYEQYSGQMYSICLRYCKQEALAADALQLGFIKIFKYIGSFKGESTIGAWIKKIIVRSAIDQLKKERHINFQYGLDMIKDENHSYNMKIEFDQINFHTIIKLLDQLPDGYRMVFSMFVLDDMKHNDIADALNITESTSRSQLFKAKKMLQSLIKERPEIMSTYNY